MAEDDEAAPDPRRKHERRLVFMRAVLTYGELGNSIPCRVRNISEGGARLEFEQQQLLPHHFDLKIRDLPPLRCELRWAKDKFAGVRFLKGEE